MSVRDWKGTAKMTVKKLGEIIGTTTDTGGTATEGTLIAKVNAILNTVVNGVKVSGEVTIKETAQTKKFTTSVYGSVNKGNTKTISGCGRALIWFSANSFTPKITVDGIEFSVSASNNYHNGVYEFYFNTSIKVNANSTDSTDYIYYFVQT